jgi:uncharacterized repeat protein (TIGR02543 family)
VYSKSVSRKLQSYILLGLLLVGVFAFAYEGVNFAAFASGNAPTQGTPLLVSSLGTNTTIENLICTNQSTSDPEADNVTNIYNWYKNDTSLTNLLMPFDTNSSTTVKDYSGYSNTGTVNGATWTSDGKVGGCYSFNGTNNDVTIADASNLDGDGLWAEITIEHWIYLSVNQFATRTVSKMCPSTTAQRSYQIGFQTTGTSGGVANCLYGAVVVGSNSYQEAYMPYTSPLNTSVWYYVVLTYKSGDGVRVYLNGVQVAFKAVGVFNIQGSPDKPLYVGRRYETTGTFFNGKIDDVRLYNRSLSSAQILQRYTESKDGFSSSSKVVPPETALNDVWKCEVTPNDGTQDGAATFSNTLQIISPAPPNYNDVVFDSSFAMGNLINVQYQGGDAGGFRYYTAELNYSTATSSDHHIWFYFSMQNVSGKTVKIQFKNLATGDFPTRWPNVQPVYTLDNAAWSYVPTGNYSCGDATSRDFNITLSASQDKVWLARAPAYTVTMRDDLFASYSSSTCLNVTSLGTTPLGQSLKVATITDPAYSDAGKFKVYVIAQQHGGETVPTFVADGMIRFLLDETNSTAAALRQSCIFKIIPIVNVEGNYYGIYRYTPSRSGVQYDLNRAWDDNPISTVTTPEVNWTFTDVQNWMPDVFIDMHSDSASLDCWFLHDGLTDSAMVNFMNNVSTGYTGTKDYWPETGSRGTGTSEGSPWNVRTRLGIHPATMMEYPNDDRTNTTAHPTDHNPQTTNDWKDWGTRAVLGIYDYARSETPYSLTVNTSGNGSVTRNPDQTTYTYGTNVTLTAYPGTGWVFSGWSGDLTSTENPVNITMNSEKNVTATFSQSGYSLIVSIVGNGSVTKNPNQTTYAYGTNVTLTAYPDAGWAFASWSGDISGTGNPTVINMTSSKSVTATFKVLLVDSDFNSSTDSADLRTNSAGQDWYESRGTLASALTLDQNDVTGDTGKKAALKTYSDGTDNSVYLTQEFYSPQNGNFSVSFDINIDQILDTSNLDRGAFIMLGDDFQGTNGPCSTGVERFVQLAFWDSTPGTSGSDITLVAREYNNPTALPPPAVGQPFATTSTWTVVKTGLSYDTWMNVRIDVDFVAGTYDVYVDGVLAKAGIHKYEQWNSTTSTDIEYISFAIGGATTTSFGKGDFYVDNVFSPAVDRYTLTVTTVGNGSVARNPGEASYASGTEVTLTANASIGWVFNEWTGDLLGSTNPANITMSSHKSVTATFIVETPTLGINATFDSASIGSYNISSNEINFTLTTEYLTTGEVYTYWTYFKVTNTLGKEVTFRILNANLVPFLSTTSEEAQMVYSYDGIDWSRFTNHSYSSGIYTFSTTFTNNQVYVATFFPFSYTEMQSYTNTVDASPWAVKSILGSSEQSREISLLKITNSSIPDADKKVIYIIGRQHSAETCSSHMLKGLIDFLISDNADAQRMRNAFIWYIVPMVNPDGVYLGKSRATSEDRNANRDWKNDLTVEINIVRDHIVSINNTLGIDFFIDAHSQMNDIRWYNFVYSPPGNTFFNILSAWTDFDVQSVSAPGNGSASSCTARQYLLSENIILDPMFGLEPAPHLYTWTIASLRQQGVNVAYAINEYFNYTLTATTIGNGQVSASPTGPVYTYGTVVTLNATADPGWNFNGWGGNLSGSTNPTTITMTSNKTVTATFTEALWIDATFESASIGNYTIIGNQINLTILGEPVVNTGGTYTYWTYFEVDNVDGETVTFRVTNAIDIDFLTKTTEETQMVYSYDGENWLRFPTGTYSGGVYTFSTTFTGDNDVYVATFFPFTYTKMSDYINSIDPSPYVETSLLGLSEQGRDIKLVKITNPAIPEASKQTIYIIGRQHASETCSSYMIKGLIDFLLTDDPVAQRSRDAFVYYIVPMVNPDGVYLGKSRVTSENRDANRDWAGSESVEINTVRANIDAVDASNGIDFFIDWHNQMDDLSWFNYIYSPSGNTFFPILSSWTDFDSQTSPGVGSTSCRGYVTTVIQPGFMATFEPTPHLYTWTTSSLQTQGMNVAKAIEDYYDPVPFLVDPSFDASVDSADLRNNATAQDWYESRGNFSLGDSSLLTLNSSDVGGDTSKKAALKNNLGTTTNAYLTQEFSSPQTGTFSVSFDIYIDWIEDNANYDRTGHIYIGNDAITTNAPTGQASERFVLLAFYDPTPGTMGNDLELRARTLNTAAQAWATTSLWPLVASGLSYDTWYTIRIEVNITGMTYDVYVDGVLRGNDLAKMADYNSTSITHMTFGLDSDARGGFYVDNVYSPSKDMYKLAVNTVGSGSVSKNPGESTYSPGTNVTLTATPADGWSFNGWSGDLIGYANPATITMNGNKTVTASFTLSESNLVINSVVIKDQGCKIYANDTYANGTDFSVPIELTIINSGPGSAGQFNVSLQVYWTTGSQQESNTQQTVASLSSGQNVTLTFNFRPTHTGYYNLTATADCNNAITESNETDNSLSKPNIPVTTIGDINGDGVINIFDAVIISLAWGSTPVDSYWNIRADINHDNTVNLLDGIRIASHWGETW